MMVKIRKPEYNSNGTIDCELNHPAFGWVPFTASPDDVEAHGREIYATALRMNPAAYVPPAAQTPAQKDTQAVEEATKRMTDPLVVVLAKAAGVPLAQFEADLAAEIRLRL